MTLRGISDRDPIKSVTTTLRIIEFLEREDESRVTEIAEALDIAKSTAHRHLDTLYRKEYVVKDGDLYKLSLRFLELGEFVHSREDAYTMAKKKVDFLADQTDERAQFMVEEHGRAIYIYRKAGRNAVQTDPGIGKRTEIHASSAGKSILAHMPREAVAEIIDRRGLPRLTENTITSSEDLYEELNEIKDRGYAFNNQENIEGLKAVGVPIMGRGNRVIGAISVSGPNHRMKGDWFEEEIPDLLLGIANELELNIQYR